MAHELHDDGFHEIQLSGKQLVFLFMATTVVSIVIFLCGVLVGRGVQNGRGAVSPSTIVEAGNPLDLPDESAAPPPTGKPTNVEGLTYPNNLQATEPPAAEVQAGAADDLKQSDAGAPPPTVAAAEPAPTPAGNAAARPEPKAAPPTAAATPAPAAPPTPAPTAAAAAAAAAAPSPAAAPGGDGGFTVQVTALKNRPEADTIANRLQSRGYKAYVVAPAAGGQVMYKVRVGMNMQRDEADKVMRRLQREEKFKPWITR